jgi:hypothetical protein
MGPKASVLHFIMPIRDVFYLCIVPYCYERVSSVLCETWITVSKIVILRQMYINRHSYILICPMTSVISLTLNECKTIL